LILNTYIEERRQKRHNRLNFIQGMTWQSWNRFALCAEMTNDTSMRSKRDCVLTHISCAFSDNQYIQNGGWWNRYGNHNDDDHFNKYPARRCASGGLSTSSGLYENLETGFYSIST
jgi:hypothetical protein